MMGAVLVDVFFFKQMVGVVNELFVITMRNPVLRRRGSPFVEATRHLVKVHNRKTHLDQAAVATSS